MLHSETDIVFSCLLFPRSSPERTVLLKRTTQARSERSVVLIDRPRFVFSVRFTAMEGGVRWGVCHQTRPLTTFINCKTQTKHIGPHKKWVPIKPCALQSVITNQVSEKWAFSLQQVFFFTLWEADSFQSNDVI